MKHMYSILVNKFIFKLQLEGVLKKHLKRVNKPFLLYIYIFKLESKPRILNLSLYSYMSLLSTILTSNEETLSIKMFRV